MARITLGIQYLGGAYRGWQTQQDGVKTIQSYLERALSNVANEPIVLHAAGRTDAGVNASNMVAHFDTNADRLPKSWIMGVNSQLPHDISVSWAQEMPDEFHARFSATARRYRYILYHQPYRSALLNHMATHVYGSLDIKQMQAATQLLEGTHDFTSFRAVGCQSRQPVRHVHHAKLFNKDQFIVLDIQANGFLHHMVRNIIGVLLKIGRQEQPVEWINTLYEVKDRTVAGITAPPQGLYFINALYPEQFSLPNVLLGPDWLNLDGFSSS